MKQIKIHPVALGVMALIIAGSSFAVGHELRFVKVGMVTGQVVPLDYNRLNDVYDTLVRKFDGDIDKQKLMDGAKAGLVAAAGDPYTTYLTAKEAKDLSNDLSGQLSGIGAELALKNKQLTVVAPLAGSPAEKVGVRSKDIILRINGEDATVMTLGQAVSKIRGPKDTQVKLQLLRGTAAPFELTITRQEITVPSITSGIKPGNIGYIKLSRFGDDTSTLIVETASRLKQQGATKVILDLRDNPGGYLDAGVGVASQFMAESKLVVEERRGSASIEKLYSKGSGNLVGLPMVVLINGGSASASEIVAGALHDSGVAQLVGEKSFGKGSVQDITKLDGGAELKVTIAHWYTPNGKNINKEGIAPDIEVKMTPEDYNASRDPQLDKALDLLK